MTRILIVDDEPQIRRALRINLQARQYDVVTAANGAEALHAAATHKPALVVLDLGLPDIDGIDVIRKLRAWNPVPHRDPVRAHEQRRQGPRTRRGRRRLCHQAFGMEELLARIRAVSRRLSSAEIPAPVRIGRYTVNVADRRADVDDQLGQTVHLTPIEWQLLEVLVRNPGKLVGQRHLLQEIWGPSYSTETQYLRQYMKHLRRKLEDDPARPRHLLTEPGMGYRFQP